jgi:DNA (cytosine-5)-methyltransferase 1
MPKREIKAVDFFCSGGGMTNGMRQAGIKVIAGIDFDSECKETYEINNKGSKFIHADIFKLKESDLQKQLALTINDNDLLLIGCSPCQFWSLIRTDKKKSEQSKDLLSEFHRFVKYFNPGYVVVENVPGIMSRKDESGLTDFVLHLENVGYKVKYDVVNLNEYGVPQTRKRFSLVATRVNENFVFPVPSKEEKPSVKDFIGTGNGFPKVCVGYKDISPFQHTVAKMSEKNLERLMGTPSNCGSSLWWWTDKKLGREKYHKDGFKDSYSRMSWDKPAPTITTKFFSISNGRFGHPEEHRAISIREGATLQTFPKNYIFCSKSIQVTARMIGNAVPPEYAKKIGEAIINSKKSGSKTYTISNLN